MSPPPTLGLGPEGPCFSSVVLGERELGRSGDAWISREAAATTASSDTLSLRVQTAADEVIQVGSGLAHATREKQCQPRT